VFAVIDDSVLAAIEPALVTLGVFFLCAALWPKPVATGRAFMVAGSFAMMTQYTWWRITETLPAPALNFEFALAFVFLAAELIGIATAALSLMFLTRTRDRSPEADANAGWLASLEQPAAIDVLICSYNEDKEILERTIVGALGMDYPNFRVWMLDDSRRDWVKALCAELGCLYLSRPDNAHAKAGNINHALKHIAALPNRPEFVSILDADFVPAPQFLKHAMSLFRDSTSASCRRRNISSILIRSRSISAPRNSGPTSSASSSTSCFPPRMRGPPHSVAAPLRSSACSHSWRLEAFRQIR
jgi:cellulose synthase (UDP-forming)